MSTGKNPVSESSAPIAKLGGYRYYDLPGNLEVMGKVMRESVVDGFELQLLPEWDGENPPLTDAQYADWGETSKYAPENVLTMLEGRGLPVLSLHANRDIGCYLCSERGRDLEKGRRLAQIEV